MSAVLQFLHRLPWVSLLLMLIAYGTFGWSIAEIKIAHHWWALWLPAELLAVMLAFITTSPLRTLERIINQWFKSNLTSFVAAVGGAFLVVVMLTWIHVFAYLLVLVASEALVRLDLQTGGFNERQSFWLLIVIAFAGLGAGWATYNIQWVLTHVL